MKTLSSICFLSLFIFQTSQASAQKCESQFSVTRSIVKSYVASAAAVGSYAGIMSFADNPPTILALILSISIGGLIGLPPYPRFLSKSVNKKLNEKNKMDKKLKVLRERKMEEFEDIYSEKNPMSKLQLAFKKSLKEKGTDKMRDLIRLGANINAPLNDNGKTPIMVVKDIEKAQLLIDEGADVNAHDLKNGDTALTLNISQLWPGDSLDIIQLLISAGADVNAGKKYLYNQKPLMIATSRMDNLELIQLLVEQKADVNAQSTFDETALMVASRYLSGKYREEVIKFLRRNGADPNLKNDQEETALEIATKGEGIYLAPLFEKLK